MAERKNQKKPTSCGAYFLRKENPTRYRAHHRLDVDYPQLLLEVMTQFQF